MRTPLGVIVATVVCLFGVNAQALDLVRDGKAVSTIVVPKQATETEQAAAERLVKYLKMASGAELPVVRESARPEAGPLISVGKTEMANAAGITEEGLKYDGYRLAVKDNTLYLLGRDTELIEAQRIFRAPLMGGAQGSIRAAFGLLDRLGFRWLQPTPMGTHVPELKTVSIPDDLDVTYEPPSCICRAGCLTGTTGRWRTAFACRSRRSAEAGTLGRQPFPHRCLTSIRNAS